MAEYQVHTNVNGRKDKITIAILIGSSERKEFDIHITDEGLRITTGLDIRVNPKASNVIIVDEAG